MFYVLVRWSIEHQRWRVACFADESDMLYRISEPDDLVLAVYPPKMSMRDLLAALPRGPGGDQVVN